MLNRKNDELKCNLKTSSSVQDFETFDGDYFWQKPDSCNPLTKDQADKPEQLSFQKRAIRSSFPDNNSIQIFDPSIDKDKTISSRKQRKEERIHGTHQVPYHFYQNKIPEYFPGVPIHWHDELELMRVNSGQGTLYLEGEILELDQGAICLILPDQLHGIEGHMDYDTLVFYPSMLAASLQERSFQTTLRFLVDASCKISQPIYAGPGNPMDLAMRLIFGHMAEDCAAADLYIRSGLLMMAGFLEEQALIFKSLQTPALLDQYEPVLRQIQAHLDEKIRIKDLAETMNLSESRFQHCFSTVFHCSPMEYVLRLRIEKACQLLRQTQETIAQIALDCGFGNLAHFNRQFLKRTGMTPRQYRTLRLQAKSV